MVDLNMKSTFFFSTEVAKGMISSDGGKIVNMSSQASIVAIQNESIYCATKGGINQLTKALAAEWAEHNIRVNAIAPTFVRTPGTAERLDDPVFYQNVLRNIPLKRIASIEDIANSVAFLSSPLSDMITGAILLVDGGWTLV